MGLERKAALRAASAHTVQYERRRPEETVLHCLLREHLETFLAEVEARTGAGLGLAVDGVGVDPTAGTGS